MSYLALYRKYRSQTFDELVGQEAIVTTLKNALSTGKIAHAYLFSGPRGTGKTSVARLFAKALNCSEGIGHQCNNCDNCTQISDGSHPDVIEIDAASNSGVDEVRSLIEKVKYSPIKGRYKIYIIDEVHMMTNSAFNALLKTLEEPPAYVIFILCTTEPYKLLPTILSRCQRYEFNKISESELKKLLTSILEKENITCEDGVINQLTEIANGGARDALSILDQLIAYSGNNITLKNIEDVFGLTSNKEKTHLFSLIKEKDTLNTLEFVNELNKRNVDISRLVSELLLLLKDALVYIKCHKDNLLESSKPSDVIEIEKILNEDELNKLIDLFMECQKELKITNNPNFLFEIYILKAIKSEKEAIISEPLEVRKDSIINTTRTTLKDQIDESTNKPIIEAKRQPLEIHQSIQNIVETQKEEASTGDIDIKLVSIEGDSYHLDDDTLIKLMVVGNKQLKKDIIDLWSRLNTYMNTEDAAFAALLLDGQPFIATKKHLILSYNYKKPAAKLNIKSNQKTLSKLIEKLTGNKFFIYAVNRDDNTRSIQHYLNLQQLNKLPKDIDVEKIEIK